MKRKRLAVQRETIRQLTEADRLAARGGVESVRTVVANNCDLPSLAPVCVSGGITRNDVCDPYPDPPR